ncbi:MAG: class I SAM-dependent methyltransferase [Thermodesulfovibrionales bacterium]
MDPYGKQELVSSYDRHLRDFGDHPQAVRWTPEGQAGRYDALFSIAGDISDRELLDFGCGKGDFYGFLKDKNTKVKYCGVDVNKNLIELATKKYPEAEFVSVDIEDDRFDRAFDLIFVCGVFNMRIAGIEESMKSCLKILFGIGREALHFNALSYNIPQRNVELYYVKPEELLQFVSAELSDNVVLRDDIIKGDIFLSVHK